MLNKMILIGNIESANCTGSNKDPVVQLSITTRKTWKSRKDHKKQEHIETHFVIVKGKKKVKYTNNLKIGSKVYIEGMKITRCSIAGVTKDDKVIKSYRCEIEATEIKEMQ